MLAAGAATRFGSPKQRLLLPLVLERLAAAEAVETTLVVVGAHRVEVAAPTVECPDWHRGPGASLRCGLEALPPESEAAVVVLADGPELDPRAVDGVVAAWRAGAGAVLAATYDGRTRSHPVLLDRRVWADVPLEGARRLDATLVPMLELEGPGDVDTADDFHGRFGRPPAESR